MKLFDHALASPSIEEEPVKPAEQSEQSWRVTSISFHCRSLCRS